MISLVLKILAQLAASTRKSALPMDTPEDYQSAAPVKPRTPIEILQDECAALGVLLIDYRDLEKWPRNKEYDWREYGYPGDKSRALPKGERTWNHTTAVMLHTYDVAGMGYKRFLGVPAHAGIDCDGNVVLMHEPTRILWHGNAANSFSYGIEISGKSNFDSPTQIKSARALLRYITAERAANIDPAGPYTGPMAIMAHRQSRESRGNDPGAPVWLALGEWAKRELGMPEGPVVGSGRPIPASWR